MSKVNCIEAGCALKTTKVYCWKHNPNTKISQHNGYIRWCQKNGIKTKKTMREKVTIEPPPVVPIDENVDAGAIKTAFVKMQKNAVEARAETIPVLKHDNTIIWIPNYNL